MSCAGESTEEARAVLQGRPSAPNLRVPLITAAMEGIGGTIKSVPEDFEVEEIPAYQPAGTGEHLFLWIEKRGVAAEQLLRHIARALGISTSEIGCAGLKDRHAVTRQYISVPCRVESAVPAIDAQDIRVLEVQRHPHKLRTGHLGGNRFRVLVRDVVPDALTRAEKIRSLLLQGGMANFFGEQRFGHDSETAILGLQLLRGEIQSIPGGRSHDRFLRKLALSAAQAVLFNQYLAQRIQDGLLHTVLDGDVMHKETGGIFYVTDRNAEQARLDRRETVTAGPIYGKKMFAARGHAAAREAQILEQAGISQAQLRSFGRLVPGTRRRTLVYLDDIRVTPLPAGLEFQFSLPAGSYATVLLGEFIK